jgi:ATPases involved in chromosome partitioning
MYDYVFIDCPPIDIIADTDIVSQFVDTTVFVIRAGLMERGWLEEINKIYEEQRFKNLRIMLNGTLAGNAYSRHRYGGYYGHYHYGYYYGSKSKK